MSYNVSSIFELPSDYSKDLGFRTEMPRHLHTRLLDELGHYANMSVQYTAIFHGCKNGNFHMKKIEIFLIFAQNIDRWYTLEPPH